MIQGILTYQFILNQQESGEIEPEFRPIKLVFNKDANDFTPDDYSDLIVENDIFAIFYQHTTGVMGAQGGYSNYYSGRLKETMYQVISFFKQDAGGAQFLAISVFDTDDEIEIYEGVFKNLTKQLNVDFETYLRANSSRQLNLISKINDKMEEDIKFTIFQVDRLSNLSKLQKAALIFHSDERMKILEVLREGPIAKREMKRILEKIKINPNVDILIEPFLELNLIRRDWITGETDKKKRIDERLKGEFLFLTKDIVLARVPNHDLIDNIKETNEELHEKYRQKVVDFFAEYDPLEQVTHGVKDAKLLASNLLNPDIYDFIQLMREKHYPLDKIPKILSSWADVDEILEDLRYLDVITEIKDKKGRKWLFLLTDIKPLVIFPEYLLPKIRSAYKSKDKEEHITHEIAKKALDLLEVTYNETVDI